MSIATVSDAMYGIGAVSNGNTTANTERTQSKESDFGQFMSKVREQAKQTVYQPDKQLTQKSATQSKDVYEAETQKKTMEKDVFKKDSVDYAEKEKVGVSEEKIAGQEVEKAVEDAAKEVMEEIEDTLEVTEEELLDVMEQLGLQLIDLLNPDNLTALMAQMTGEGTEIGLVMDEDMYLALQDLMQMLDEKTQELLNATGLSDEELEAVLDQLKLLIEQKLSAEEGMPTQSLEQGVGFMEMEEAIDDSKIPVIVKEDANMQEIPNVELAQETPNVELAQETPEGIAKESQRSEDSLFQQQQENMQGFQNMENKMTEVVQESQLANSDTPTTESILKQLADYVKVQKGEELTEMELQLHPASLGSVRVTLSTKAGIVTAQLTTENETVKNAIESQVSQLKLSLEEQGVKVEAIEVSVASHQMERNLEQNAGEGQNKEQADESSKIHKIRKNSINLNSFDSEEELLEEITEADDATKIAMEMMAIGGNRMDLLA